VADAQEDEDMTLA
jgi:hypothetical protein